MAFVVRKSGSSIDEESIIQFIARQVNHYHTISLSRIIPKTHVGRM